MLVATWNVNSLKARLERVIDWIDHVRPGVLCLQETKMKEAAFPAGAFAELGYESTHFGTGQWNGVAIVSSVGLDAPASGFHPGAGIGSAVAGSADGAAEFGEARIVSATCGGIRVSSVYVPNGRSVGSEHFAAKLRWLAALRRHLEATCSPEEPVAVCGDFNVAPEDRDVWDPAALEGMTHATPEERAALAELESWGLVDAFRLFYEAGGLYSWWDYRGGSFHKGVGMRIDLVFVSEPLARRTRGALIDRNARKGPQPSDHAPVVVEVGD